MAMYVWVGMIIALAVFGLVYIVLDKGVSDVNVEMNETLTDDDNVQAFDYQRAVWQYLPVIIFVILVFWAAIQSQKQY